MNEQGYLRTHTAILYLAEEAGDLVKIVVRMPEATAGQPTPLTRELATVAYRAIEAHCVASDYQVSVVESAS